MPHVINCWFKKNEYKKITLYFSSQFKLQTEILCSLINVSNFLSGMWWCNSHIYYKIWQSSDIYHRIITYITVTIIQSCNIEKVVENSKANDII